MTARSATATARFVCGIKGMWAPDEPDADAYRDWVRNAGAAAAAVLDRRHVHQFSDGGRGR